MPGFHFHTISFDFMHNCYLGTARDLCSSGPWVNVYRCNRSKKNTFVFWLKEWDGPQTHVPYTSRFNPGAIRYPSLAGSWQILCRNFWVDEVLSHVQAKMRDTCSKHGLLSSTNVTFAPPKTESKFWHIYLFGLKSTWMRFSMPRKPYLTAASLGGEDGYSELGSRFKASHVKLIIWWLSKESQEFADSKPDVTWIRFPIYFCF